MWSPFFILVLSEQKMILCVSTENVYWKANVVTGALEVCLQFCPCSHEVLLYKRSRVEEQSGSSLGVAAVAEGVTALKHVL